VALGTFTVSVGAAVLVAGGTGVLVGGGAVAVGIVTLVTLASAWIWPPAVAVACATGVLVGAGCVLVGAGMVDVARIV
jgi:hypothetical protein